MREKVDVAKTMINVGGQHFSLPGLALIVIAVGILFPSVAYSLRLTDPTPSQLVVAICIALFSASVFLWILDATSVLRFRADWISKAVYSAAIASVLSTSALVYKNAFGRQYPYEGAWELTIGSKADSLGRQRYVSVKPVILAYSESSERYAGYSNYNPGTADDLKNPTSVAWIEVESFTPNDGKLRMLLMSYDNSVAWVEGTVKLLRHGALLEGSGASDTLRLERPK
jgi:hypothetical protein